PSYTKPYPCSTNCSAVTAYSFNIDAGGTRYDPSRAIGLSFYRIASPLAYRFWFGGTFFVRQGYGYRTHGTGIALLNDKRLRVDECAAHTLRIWRLIIRRKGCSDVRL